MGLRLGGGFAAGLLAGQRFGSQLAGAYKQASLDADLGDAGNRAQATEEMVGAEAQSKAAEIERLKADEFNRARDAAVSANPEDAPGAEQAGLAAARQYDPAIAEAQRLGAKEKPGYVVGRKGFASEGEAQTAANNSNNQSMAAVYRQHGQPEEANRLQAQSQSLEAGGLQLKGAKREDAIAGAMSPLKLAQIQFEVESWPQELERRVMAKEVSFDDAQREVGKRFVASLESVPEVAQGWVKNGFMAKVSPVFKGATDIGRDGDNLVVAYEDGSKKAVPYAALKRWAAGGSEPVKFTSLSEGASLIATDARGNAKVVAKNEKAPDQSKSNAAMDDAVSTMTRLLDTNKNMMTQFGGNEQKAREDMRINHDKGVGEFQRRAGRPPTVEEAAVIAEGVFKKAQAKYLGGK